MGPKPRGKKGAAMPMALQSESQPQRKNSRKASQAQHKDETRPSEQVQPKHQNQPTTSKQVQAEPTTSKVVEAVPVSVALKKPDVQDFKRTLNHPSEVKESSKNEAKGIYKGSNPESTPVSSEDERPKSNSKDSSILESLAESLDERQGESLDTSSETFKSEEISRAIEVLPVKNENESDVDWTGTLAEENAEKEDLLLTEQKLISEIENSFISEIMESVCKKFPKVLTGEYESDGKMEVQDEDSDLPESMALKDYACSGAVRGKIGTCKAILPTHVLENSLNIRNAQGSDNEVGETGAMSFSDSFECKDRSISVSLGQPVTISTPNASECQDSGNLQQISLSEQVSIWSVINGSLQRSYESAVQPSVETRSWKYRDWTLQRDASKAVSTPRQDLFLSVTARLDSSEMCDDTMSPIALQSSTGNLQDESLLKVKASTENTSGNPDESHSLSLCEKMSSLNIDAKVALECEESFLNGALSPARDGSDEQHELSKSDVQNLGFIHLDSSDNDSTDFAVHIAEDDLMKLSLLHNQMNKSSSDQEYNKNPAPASLPSLRDHLGNSASSRPSTKPSLPPLRDHLGNSAPSSPPAKLEYAARATSNNPNPATKLEEVSKKTSPSSLPAKRKERTRALNRVKDTNTKSLPPPLKDHLGNFAPSSPPTKLEKLARETSDPPCPASTSTVHRQPPPSNPAAKLKKLSKKKKSAALIPVKDTDTSNGPPALRDHLKNCSPSSPRAMLEELARESSRPLSPATELKTDVAKETSEAFIPVDTDTMSLPPPLKDHLGNFAPSSPPAKLEKVARETSDHPSPTTKLYEVAKETSPQSSPAAKLEKLSMKKKSAALIPLKDTDTSNGPPALRDHLENCSPSSPRAMLEELARESSRPLIPATELKTDVAKETSEAFIPVDTDTMSLPPPLKDHLGNFAPSSPPAKLEKVARETSDRPSPTTKLYEVAKETSPQSSPPAKVEQVSKRTLSPSSPVKNAVVAKETFDSPCPATRLEGVPKETPPPSSPAAKLEKLSMKKKSAALIPLKDTDTSNGPPALRDHLENSSPSSPRAMLEELARESSSPLSPATELKTEVAKETSEAFTPVDTDTMSLLPPLKDHLGNFAPSSPPPKLENAARQTYDRPSRATRLEEVAKETSTPSSPPVKVEPVLNGTLSPSSSVKNAEITKETSDLPGPSNQLEVVTKETSPPTSPLAKLEEVSKGTSLTSTSVEETEVQRQNSAPLIPLEDTDTTNSPPPLKDCLVNSAPSGSSVNLEDVVRETFDPPSPVSKLEEAGKETSSPSNPPAKVEQVSKGILFPSSPIKNAEIANGISDSLGPSTQLEVRPNGKCPRSPPAKLDEASKETSLPSTSVEETRVEREKSAALIPLRNTDTTNSPPPLRDHLGHSAPSSPPANFEDDARESSYPPSPATDLEEVAKETSPLSSPPEKLDHVSQRTSITSSLVKKTEVAKETSEALSIIKNTDTMKQPPPLRDHLGDSGSSRSLVNFEDLARETFDPPSPATNLENVAKGTSTPSSPPMKMEQVSKGTLFPSTTIKNVEVVNETSYPPSPSTRLEVHPKETSPPTSPAAKLADVSKRTFIPPTSVEETQVEREKSAPLIPLTDTDANNSSPPLRDQLGYSAPSSPPAYLEEVPRESSHSPSPATELEEVAKETSPPTSLVEKVEVANGTFDLPGSANELEMVTKKTSSPTSPFAKPEEVAKGTSLPPSTSVEETKVEREKSAPLIPLKDTDANNSSPPLRDQLGFSAQSNPPAKLEEVARESSDPPSSAIKLDEVAKETSPPSSSLAKVEQVSNRTSIPSCSVKNTEVAKETFDALSPITDADTKNLPSPLRDNLGKSAPSSPLLGMEEVTRESESEEITEDSYFTSSPPPELEEVTKESSSTSSPPPELEEVAEGSSSTSSPPPELEEVTEESSSTSSPPPALEEVTEESSPTSSPPPELEEVTKESSSTSSPPPELEEVAEGSSSTSSPPPELEEVTEESSSTSSSPPELEEVTEESSTSSPPPELEEVTEESRAPSISSPKFKDVCEEISTSISPPKSDVAEHTSTLSSTRKDTESANSPPRDAPSNPILLLEEVAKETCAPSSMAKETDFANENSVPSGSVKEETDILEGRSLPSRPVEEERVDAKGNSSPPSRASKNNGLERVLPTPSNQSSKDDDFTKEPSTSSSPPSSGDVLVNEQFASSSQPSKDGVLEKDLSTPSSPASKENDPEKGRSATSNISLKDDDLEKKTFVPPSTVSEDCSLAQETSKLIKSLMEGYNVSKMTSPQSLAMKDDDMAKEPPTSVSPFMNQGDLTTASGEAHPYPSNVVSDAFDDVYSDLGSDSSPCLESSGSCSSELSFGDAEGYSDQQVRPQSVDPPSQYYGFPYFDTVKRTLSRLSSSFENLLGRISPIFTVDNPAETKPEENVNDTSKCDNSSESFSGAPCEKPKEEAVPDFPKDQTRNISSVTSMPEFGAVSTPLKGDEFSDSTLNEVGKKVDTEMPTEDLAKRMQAMFDRIRRMELQLQELGTSPIVSARRESPILSQTIDLDYDEDYMKVLPDAPKADSDASPDVERHHPRIELPIEDEESASPNQQEAVRPSVNRSVSFSEKVVLLNDKDVETSLHETDLPKPKFAPTPFRPSPPITSRGSSASLDSPTKLVTNAMVEAAEDEPDIRNKTLSSVRSRPPTPSPKKGYLSMRSRLVRESPSSGPAGPTGRSLNLTYAEDKSSNSPSSSEKLARFVIDDLD